MELGATQTLMLSAFFAAGLSTMGVLMGRNRVPEEIEQAFIPMTLFSVSAMAFAHGSNDVANSLGPMTLVLELPDRGSVPGPVFNIPLWLFLISGTGIAVDRKSVV